MKINDFVTIEGQIAKITSVKHRRPNKNTPYSTQVRIVLVGDNLTHWVDVKEIQPLSDQKAAQVLYNKKSA